MDVDKFVIIIGALFLAYQLLDGENTTQDKLVIVLLTVIAMIYCKKKLSEETFEENFEETFEEEERPQSQKKKASSRSKSKSRSRSKSKKGSKKKSRSKSKSKSRSKSTSKKDSKKKSSKASKKASKAVKKASKAVKKASKAISKATSKTVSKATSKAVSKVVSTSSCARVDEDKSDMKYTFTKSEPIGTYDKTFTNDWKQDYVLLHTDKWRPPVYPFRCDCRNQVAAVPTKGYPVALKEWDASRRVMPADNINVEYIKERLNKVKY